MRNGLGLLLGVFYNAVERRLRAFWRLLIGIALGHLVLGTVRAFALYILAFLLMLTAQIPFDALRNAEQMSQTLNLAYDRLPLIAGIRSLIVLLLVGLAILLVARWIDRRPWQDYGFHFKQSWWRDLGFGLLLGLALMGIVFGFEYLLGWWNFAQGYIFGFAVSGSDAQISLLATVQAGPAGWTGGAFGPEGGLMGPLAALLGAVMIYIWVRWSGHRASLEAQLAQYSPADREAMAT